MGKCWFTIGKWWFTIGKWWFTWYTYPSEKYESQLGWLFPNLWKNKHWSKPLTSVDLLCPFTNINSKNEKDDWQKRGNWSLMLINQPEFGCFTTTTKTNGSLKEQPIFWNVAPAMLSREKTMDVLHGTPGGKLTGCARSRMKRVKLFWSSSMPAKGWRREKRARPSNKIMTMTVV